MDVFDLVAKIKLDKTEYENGLDDAEKQANGFSDKVDTIKKVGIGLGATFSAVGVAGFKFAQQTANEADEIDKMSQKLGVSAEKYQEWDYVMNLAGTSMGNMSTGLKTLTNKLDDAKNGSEDAQNMFKSLGISMEDLSNMSREEVFEAAIYGFQGMADSTERAALANDLFGRSGQELTPLFNQTTEETQVLIQNLHDLGGVMSDDAVKSGAAFNDSITTLKASFDGVKNSLAAELLPSFTSLAEKLAEFIGNGGLSDLIDKFQKLIPILGGVATAFVAFKVAGSVAAIFSTLQKATEGVTVAQGLLNIVMMANPFVLIVAAIAGLVAALVVLWHTNDDFREAVIKAWETIKAGIEKMVDAIVVFFTKKIPDAVKKLLTIFNNLPSEMIKVGTEIVNGLWNGISSGWTWLTDKVKNLAKGLLDAAKSVLGIHSPSKEFAYLAEMCVEGMDNVIGAYNPYKTIDEAFDQNEFTAPTLNAYTPTSVGNIDVSGITESITNALSGFSITLDGKTVGKLVAQSVNSELGIINSRRT